MLRRIAKIFGWLLLLDIVITIALFALVPLWLSPEDSVRPCGAIVVLNGDPFSRADEAARLYHGRYAAEVWLTDDPKSSDAQGDVGSRSNTRRLVAARVTEAAILHVPGDATNTRAELQAIGAELRRRGMACGIDVTSPLHARRVKLTWTRRVKSPGSSCGMRPVPRTPVRRRCSGSSPDHWPSWPASTAELT